MSSTERAPEPTMEEILASIRRIITDDETGQAKAQKAEPQAQQSDEAEGEADNQIIDDIARVLSGGGETSAADEEEEILDLTAELGGLELVEEEGGDAGEAELETPVFMAAEPVAPPPPAEPFAQGMAPPRMEQPVPMAPPQPQAAPQPAPSRPQSASQEAASALERAIAALRAGQVPTSTTPQAEPFQFQSAPQPEPMPEPEPLPMAIPMEAPEPVAETHAESDQFGDVMQPDFEAQPEPALELTIETEQEAELVLTEVEMDVVGEASEPEKAPFWPSETETSEPEPEAMYEPEPMYEPEAMYEPEPVVAQVNGGSHHDGETKTLEDSIKDMLRPMLRQWLDENMPRIVREMDPEALRRNLD